MQRTLRIENPTHQLQHEDRPRLVLQDSTDGKRGVLLLRVLPALCG